MTQWTDDDLRARLAVARRTLSLRELAARIGVSHYVLHKFLAADRHWNVRESTKSRIRAWLEHPDEEDAAAQLHDYLRRLLARLGTRRVRAVELALGRAIVAAHEAAGVDIPRWVARLSKKQR